MTGSCKFLAGTTDITFSVTAMVSMRLLDWCVLAKWQHIKQRHNELLWKFDAGDWLHDPMPTLGLYRAGLDFNRETWLVQRLFPKVLAALQE